MEKFKLAQHACWHRKGCYKTIAIQTEPHAVAGKKKKNAEMVCLTKPSVSLIEQIAPVRIPFIYKVSNLQRNSFQHLAMNGCHCSIRNIHFENLGRREILAIGCA